MSFREKLLISLHPYSSSLIFTRAEKGGFKFEKEVNIFFGTKVDSFSFSKKIDEFGPQQAVYYNRETGEWETVDDTFEQSKPIKFNPPMTKTEAHNVEIIFFLPNDRIAISSCEAWTENKIFTIWEKDKNHSWTQQKKSVSRYQYIAQLDDRTQFITVREDEVKAGFFKYTINLINIKEKVSRYPLGSFNAPVNNLTFGIERDMFNYGCGLLLAYGKSRYVVVVQITLTPPSVETYYFPISSDPRVFPQTAFFSKNGELNVLSDDNIETEEADEEEIEKEVTVNYILLDLLSCGLFKNNRIMIEKQHAGINLSLSYFFPCVLTNLIIQYVSPILGNLDNKFYPNSSRQSAISPTEMVPTAGQAEDKIISSRKVLDSKDQIRFYDGDCQQVFFAKQPPRDQDSAIDKEEIEYLKGYLRTSSNIL